MIALAKEAATAAAELTQEQADAIIYAMAEAGYAHAEELARMAVAETGFGKYDDKVIKNQFASRSVYEYIKGMKTAGIIAEDHEKGLWEVAVPVGVVTALIPSTNPTSTAMFKCLICMKSRNPVILSPHPSAKNAIIRACDIMSSSAKSCGAPDNMFQCLSEVHMAGTRELMQNDGVALILATGGRDMVRAAYSSGRPALGVGPGNVPAFIERSADIPASVSMIVRSKTFDNGVICASEQAVVTECCIEDLVAREMERQGCYFLSDDEACLLARVITRGPGKLNPGIVGHTACEIAAMAGLKLPENVKVLVYREKGVGAGFPFSIEKLSPILAFYAREDWHSACLLCIDLLNFNGVGHSLVIHSRNTDVIREFALKKPVSRLLVNTPASQGAIGAATSLAPSLTLGCGAVGGSATSDNVTPLHLINIRRVAFGAYASDAPSGASCTAESCTPYSPSPSGADVEEITRKVIELLKTM